MTQKVEIIERLGESAILLPSLLGDALAANDRLKVNLSCLQEAVRRAQSPSSKERIFPGSQADTGAEAHELEALASGAQLVDPEHLFAPGLHTLLTRIGDDLGVMLAPIEAAGDDPSRTFADRLAAARETIPVAETDQIELRAIDRLTSVRAGQESVHSLVMDLHKALNRLAADTAVETLDGAHVHALNDRDRRIIRAFMQGLNRTASLAFGHPGLGTTAIRAGGRLTIQNDIGTTDAHVLVVHIDANDVTITYADNHRPRAEFFIRLFAGRGVTWEPLAEQNAKGLEKDTFYLLNGRYVSGDDNALQSFLEFLGSRIVFLIDWNRARKALQIFVGTNTAIGLLAWAAEQDFGHRAFLELGGADLIFEAVDRGAAGRIRYGVRLDQALGVAECSAFLRNVLRTASQGLAAGRGVRLIRDEVQAELSRRFETAETSILTVLIRHLGLTRMLAVAIADLLATPCFWTASARRALAARAKRLEEKGDRLTIAARERAAKVHQADRLRLVIDEIENGTDSLEDCAFLLGLMPEPDMPMLKVEPLLGLSEIVIDSISNVVRAIEAASRLAEEQRSDATTSLQAIDAAVGAERLADTAMRDTLAAVVSEPSTDARALVLAFEITRALETATDHLSHASLSLRERVLEELAA